MTTVTKDEYLAALDSVLNGGGVYTVKTTHLERGWSKRYQTENNGCFYVVMTDNGLFEFWSDKDAESRFYDERMPKELEIRLRDEAIAIYEDIIEGLKESIDAFAYVYGKRKKELANVLEELGYE